MDRSVKDISGQRFGKLTVISYSHTSKHAYWNCKCECGNEVVACGSYMRSGWTNSCGCIGKGRNPTHGQSGKNRTKEYIAWGNMIDRCYNPNHDAYPDYGGRGITVCNQWRTSFETFLTDMGLAPTPKHTIDRIRVNGNYEPNNCKWSTQKEQCNNKRNNRMVTYQNHEMTVQEWCDTLKLDHSKVRHQLRHGKSFESVVVKMLQS